MEKKERERKANCVIASLVRIRARPRRDPFASLNSHFFTLRSLQITSKSSIVFVRNIPLKVTRDTSRKHSTAGETCFSCFTLFSCKENRGRATTK